MEIKVGHFIRPCCTHDHVPNGPPKHIANPKRKDQGGRCNQSIPLLFTCRSTHKQEGSSRSFEFMRNCNTSGCFIQPCALVGDGPKHIFNSKRKDQQGCRNQSMPLLCACPSACNQGQRPQYMLSIEESQYCRLFRQAVPYGVQNRPKHIFDPKRKDAPCPNQSRPLLGTCRMARKQGWSF